MQIQAAPPLSLDEFTSALHQGRGSAFFHIRNHGSQDLFDVILDACLHERSYDPQCEGQRAKWLHTLIANDRRLCEAVVGAFAAPDEEMDLFQVANIVGALAANGDDRAAGALRRLWMENDLAGTAAIIALDGVPAAVEVARQLGQQLIQDPDEYVDDMEFLIEDASLRQKAQSELAIRARDDAAIAAYLAFHSARATKSAAEDALTGEQLSARRLQYQSEVMLEFPLSRILEMARQPDNSWRRPFARFGHLAPDTEREAILQLLESEPAPEVQCRLLWIFRSAGLPRWNDQVWKLAHSEDGAVRLAAAKALSSLEEPRVGELGRLRLAETDFSAKRSDEIELFIKNYQAGDEHIILAALERAKASDDDQVHSLGMSALRVCWNNPDQRLAEVATFVYRTNPCSLCRRDIVSWMIENECLPDWIADECRFDALEETRAMV